MDQTSDCHEILTGIFWRLVLMKNHTELLLATPSICQSPVIKLYRHRFQIILLNTDNYLVIKIKYWNIMIKLFKEIKFNYYDIWMVFGRSRHSINYNYNYNSIVQVLIIHLLRGRCFWRKFRIEKLILSQSELFRDTFRICFRTYQNYFKWIRINPRSTNIQCELFIRMNPNPYLKPLGYQV